MTDTRKRYCEIVMGERVISRSNNLRGLIRYAGKHLVAKAAVHKDSDGGAIMYVAFSDGAWTRVSFASYYVACDFVHRRRTRWGVTRVSHWPTSQTWIALEY